MEGNIQPIEMNENIEPFIEGWCWTSRCRRRRRDRAAAEAAYYARVAAAAEAARAETARRQRAAAAQAEAARRQRAAAAQAAAARRQRAEQERIRRIKEEEERRRLIEERRIQALRNEKHNKHWNTIGKNQKRVFECDDINGNRLGGRNLYMDDNGIIIANEVPIVFNNAEMDQINRTRKLNNSLSNPNWKKHKLSSGNARNFLYPYDGYTGKGDKIEYGGNSLVSNNYVFKLEMTKEGNLVLKKTVVGCTDNYTKLENVGDYNAFKTDSTQFMNSYMLVDNADRKIHKVADNMIETDNTFNAIGDYVPEDTSGMILTKDLDDSFNKCNQDNSIDHMYYIELKTGDKYFIPKPGMPEKYIPIQPDSNIKTSKLYIKNKKMKQVQPGENLPDSELYLLDRYNKTLPSMKVQRVSNYNAYSDYDINNKPVTQFQDFLGSSVSDLKATQQNMFEGFKEKTERGENEPVKTFIQTQQIQPLEKMEDEYTKKLDTINDNYNKLETEINYIMNNDKSGLRDKLMNEQKYKKSYLEFDVEQPKLVADIRLQDTQQLIDNNKTIFDLGIITACTLLVASIVIAKN